MTLRFLFLCVFFVTIFWLVKRDRLSLDLAWLLFFILAVVFGASLSPWIVENLAHIFDFGTPSMVVVALSIAGLTAICLVLVVEVSGLKRQNAQLLRKLAALEIDRNFR